MRNDNKSEAVNFFEVAFHAFVAMSVLVVSFLSSMSLREYLAIYAAAMSLIIFYYFTLGFWNKKNPYAV